MADGSAGGKPENAEAELAAATVMQVGAWAAGCLWPRSAAHLDRDDIHAFGTKLRVRLLPADHTVFRSGHWPQGVWLIRSGCVELAVEDGDRRRVIGLMREGGVFGDIPLLTRQPAPYRAQTVNLTTCLWLPAQAFDRLITERAALARLWLYSVADRLCGTEAHLLDILAGTLRQQISRLLLREAREDVVDATQSSLASMLGCPRSSVNRCLRQLAAEGAIAIGYRHVRVLDPLLLMRATAADASRAWEA